jgi:predicted aminopeptidase
MLTETLRVGALATLHLAVRARVLPGLLLLVLLGGCGTTYLLQAASGQYHVMRAREPLTRVIDDPHTSAQLRERLTLVRTARAFAIEELKLPDNKSYTTYADIKRPYVVWNVVAAPEFSLTPKEWCFPVAGCVTYRGYFNEQDARHFALEMRAQGYDTAIDPVPAYSTLGRFSDPVLSSMLRYGDADLVATIFHELAHQLLYVKDDSAFNEAFATTVEDAGLERWLTRQGSPQRMRQFRADAAREASFVRLLALTRKRLVKLYASGMPREQMLAHKRELFAELAVQIRAFEAQRGEGALEEWLDTGLNNARLASVATYYDCVPGFTRLLAAEGGDLERFYAAAHALGELPRSERHARLCTVSTDKNATPPP